MPYLLYEKWDIMGMHDAQALGHGIMGSSDDLLFSIFFLSIFNFLAVHTRHVPVCHSNVMADKKVPARTRNKAK